MLDIVHLLQMKVACRSPFDCVLKTMIPSAVEGIDYWYEMLAGIGGDEVMVYKLDLQRS